MESVCLPHTAIPGTSRLYADFLYGFDRVAGFYGEHQGTTDPVAAAAKDLEFPENRRAELVSALAKLNADNPHLSILAKPGAVAVVTGQQVGLFSGPSYAVYKALTAVKLAQNLSERGIPAVPIFWLATEDHDSQEINHCHVFDHQLSPSTLKADTSRSDQHLVGNIPLADVPLGDLGRLLGGLPHGDEVATLVANCYPEGRTYGEAFRDLMGKLLGRHKLLFLDPTRDDIRAMAAPLLRTAFDTMPELVRLVLERNSSLEKAGYHSQVHTEVKSSLLFRLEGGRRLPLKQAKQDGSLRDDPTKLSPNALLRPVMQNYILPSAAHVAGPAEVAYLAQSEVLHRRLLGRMPVVVPRSGFTLLDGRSERLLKRYGLGIEACFHGEEALRDRIASQLLDSGLGSAFQTNRRTVSDSLDQLQATLGQFDPTIAEALDTSRGKILYQLSKIEAKAAREVLRRERPTGDEIGYLHNLLFASKHL